MQIERIEEDRVDVRPGNGPRLRDPAVVPATTIQICEALTDQDHELLGEWFAAHPEADLRVYGNYGGSITDTNFLRHYPRLRGFQIDSMYSDTPDLSGLRFLPDDLRSLGLDVKGAAAAEDELARFTELETLGLGQMRRLPEAIAALRRVRRLSIAGPVKDLDVLENLTSVEDLSLRSVTAPHLEPLLAMRQLARLDIKLGGTRDLNLLSRIGALRYLELWLVRGLDDVSVIGSLEHLEEFFLQALKNITRLPDLSGLASLATVRLETMKGLRDLSPLRTAPALEELWVVDGRHLSPEDFQPLVGHPTLRRACIGLGSHRRNTEVRQLLGLPDPLD